jgi:sugar-specific transcriptional regulator TrmB
MTEATTTTEPTLRETTEQFVLENNMEAIIEKLIWQAERLKDLDRDKDQILTRLQDERATNRNNRDTVRNKFREMIDGDKNATIEMNLDDINELLEDIGASKIIFTYSVDVTVTATITGIEADSEEEARDKAIAALELRVDTDSLGEDANCEDEDYSADNAQEEDN